MSAIKVLFNAVSRLGDSSFEHLSMPSSSRFDPRTVLFLDRAVVVVVVGRFVMNVAVCPRAVCALAR